MNRGSLSRSALTIRSFAAELLEKCRPQKCHTSGKIRLALAVSGGVDSMALAGLCHSLSRNQRDIEYFSFIVDHKARPESSFEAQEVQQNLQQLGVDSKILSLEWPAAVEDPLRIPNFESLARRMRYRALAQACRDQECSSLLLGQHADDQAETLLMRLASGARGIGLLGIQAEKPIPETLDIFGIHGTGIKMSYAPLADADVGLFQHKGIRVLRPLLQFSKAQLREFCEESSIPWVEDLSNLDVTVTKRNAARLLLQSPQKVLPEALRAPSLLCLQEQISAQVKVLESRVSEIAKLSLLESYDLRSGVLRISIPSFVIPGNKAVDPAWKKKTINAMTIFLRRVAGCVSPYESVKLDSVSKFAEMIAFTNYPRTFGFGYGNEAEMANQNPFNRQFTMAGLLVNHQPYQAQALRTLTDNSGESYVLSTWELSRQPYRRDENPTLVFEPVSPPTLPSTAGAQEELSNFQLWDNRFWVSVRNSTNEAIILRHLRDTDITDLRLRLKGRHDDETAMMVNRLESVLKAVGNARSVRGTIPVLSNSERVIAFPTFHPPLDGGRDVDYDIRFRDVSPPWKDAERVTIR